MGPVVSRVELLDRQVVDADQLNAVVDEVLRAIGGEKRIVRDKFSTREITRIPGLQQNALVTPDGAWTKLGFANRHDIAGEIQQQRRTDQSFQRDSVDWLAVVEEVTRRVGVGAGM